MTFTVERPEGIHGAPWDSVLVVSGGLPGRFLPKEDVLAHWTASGLSEEDAEHFLSNAPEPNTIYRRADGTGVAFTMRACDDAARIRPDRRNCRTCHRATPGKMEYHDPEFFCDGRGLPGERKFTDATWTKALRWQNKAQPRHADQLDLSRSGAAPSWSALLDEDADNCPGWAARKDT